MSEEKLTTEDWCLICQCINLKTETILDNFIKRETNTISAASTYGNKLKELSQEISMYSKLLIKIDPLILAEIKNKKD